MHSASLVQVLEERGLWRNTAFWVTQGGKTIPKEKSLHFEICVIVSNWGNSLFFFLLEGKKKYQVTSVKEEGRQAKHSTNYSGWRKPSTSCKGTNQNNRALLKRPENALAPLPTPLSTSPHHHPSSLCLKFFPRLGQHLLTLFNSTCSHWCYLTGIFQPFHFTSASYKARSEPAALQQLVKFISVVSSCNYNPDNVLWKCLDFSLPNYPEPQFNFTTTLLIFQHLLNNPKEVYQRWFQEICCASNHKTF